MNVYICRRAHNGQGNLKIMQVHVVLYICSLKRLFFYLSTCLWLFYMHKVFLNKKIRNFDEFLALVALNQGYSEVIKWLFYLGAQIFP